MVDSMIIEKLDGFTADGFGKVIGTEKDLIDGDVERITISPKDITEKRYFAPQPAPQPSPAPIATTKQQILDQIAVLQGLADQL